MATLKWQASSARRPSGSIAYSVAYTEVHSGGLHWVSWMMETSNIQKHCSTYTAVQTYRTLVTIGIVSPVSPTISLSWKPTLYFSNVSYISCTYGSCSIYTANKRCSSTCGFGTCLPQLTSLNIGSLDNFPLPLLAQLQSLTVYVADTEQFLHIPSSLEDLSKEPEGNQFVQLGIMEPPIFQLLMSLTLWVSASNCEGVFLTDVFIHLTVPSLRLLSLRTRTGFTQPKCHFPIQIFKEFLGRCLCTLSHLWQWIT